MDNLIEIAEKELGELTGSNSSSISKKTEIPQSAWRMSNNNNSGYGGGGGYKYGGYGGSKSGHYDSNRSSGYNNQNYHNNPKYGMGYNGKKYKSFYNAENNKYSDYMEFRKAMAKSEEDFL
jgi:hypothetical protein